MLESEFIESIKLLRNSKLTESQQGVYLEKVTKYLSDLQGELPPSVKQKDLILWFQKNLKIGSLKEEKLLKPFQNPFVVNRLLFGTGSDYYNKGSKFHNKNYYKKRYMEEGKKFLQNLFATASPEASLREDKSYQFSSIYQYVNYKSIAEDSRIFLQIKIAILKNLARKESISQHLDRDANDIIDDEINRKKMLHHILNTSLESRWDEYITEFRDLSKKQLKHNKEIQKIKEANEKNKKEGKVEKPIEEKNYFEYLRSSFMSKGGEFYNTRSYIFIIFTLDTLPSFMKDEDVIRFLVSDPEVPERLLFLDIGNKDESTNSPIASGIKNENSGLWNFINQYPNLVDELKSARNRYGLQNDARTNKLINDIEKYIKPAYPAVIQKKISYIRQTFHGRYGLIGEEIIRAFKKQYALDKKSDLIIPTTETKWNELIKFLDSSLERAENPMVIKEQWCELLLPIFKNNYAVAREAADEIEDRSRKELDVLTKKIKVRNEKEKQSFEKQKAKARIEKEKKELSEKALKEATLKEEKTEEKSEPISIATVPMSAVSEPFVISKEVQYPEEIKENIKKIEEQFTGKYAFISEEIISAFNTQYKSDQTFELSFPVSENVVSGLKQFLETHRDEKDIAKISKPLENRLNQFLRVARTGNLAKKLIDRARVELAKPEVKEEKAPIAEVKKEELTPPISEVKKEEVIAPIPEVKKEEVKITTPEKKKKTVRFNDPIATYREPEVFPDEPEVVSTVTKTEPAKSEIEIPEILKTVTPAKDELKSSPSEVKLPEIPKVSVPEKKKPKPPSTARVVAPAAKVETSAVKTPEKPAPIKPPERRASPPKTVRSMERTTSTPGVIAKTGPIPSAVKPLPEVPLMSLVEREIWKKDVKKMSGTPSLVSHVDPLKSLLAEEDLAFNEVKKQGTSFVEQRIKDRYLISCQTKPTKTSYQWVGFNRIPNDDYLLYAYAQIQSLKNALTDDSKRVFIHTDDKLLSRSYALLCHLYHLPLASNQERISEGQVKAVESRMTAIFNPEPPSLISRLLGIFRTSKKEETAKPKPVATTSKATGSGSTSKVASSLRIKKESIKPMSAVQILCLTVQSDIENYEKMVPEKGKEIARFKLLEDHHLLQKLRAKSTEKSENEELDRALAQINTLLSDYTKVEEKIEKPTSTPTSTFRPR